MSLEPPLKLDPSLVQNRNLSRGGLNFHKIQHGAPETKDTKYAALLCEHVGSTET